jgi:autotransporter-associated beta strand protein
MVLTGPNTYSGGTDIEGGTLVVNNYGNVGTGPVRLKGGVFKVLNSNT